MIYSAPKLSRHITFTLPGPMRYLLHSNMIYTISIVIGGVNKNGDQNKTDPNQNEKKKQKRKAISHLVFETAVRSLT